MAPGGADGPVGDDEVAFAAYGAALADAVDAVVADWVVRTVLGRCADAGLPVTDEVRRAAADAGTACRAEVVAELRTLLAADLDAQTDTPLAVLRRAGRFPGAVLESLGAPHVVRDEFAARVDPDDVHGVAPTSFADVDESLVVPGLEWGAAKAHLHMARHRR